MSPLMRYAFLPVLLLVGLGYGVIYYSPSFSAPPHSSATIISDIAAQVPISEATLARAIKAQQKWKNTYGKYVSVANGTEVEARFRQRTNLIDVTLPEAYSFVEYETADGQVGLDLIYDDGSAIHSFGIFGPQKLERTVSIPKSPDVASSTPL